MSVLRNAFAVAVVSLVATGANAAVIDDTLAVANADNRFPIFFEDNNISLIFPMSSAGISIGDPVVGAANIQAITQADRYVDGTAGRSITDANPNTPSIVQPDGTLIALVNAEVSGVTETATQFIIDLTDRAGAATTFTDPGGGPDITVGGFGADVMIELYEDSTPDPFNRADLSDLFGSITDGIKIADIGGDDTNAALFYTVAVDKATFAVDRFELNLDFVTNTGLPPVTANDLGGDVYGTGQATGVGFEGGFVGDADFAIIIPEPASIALFSIAGVAAIRRRR